VENARARQNKRFGESGVPFNAAIPGGSVRETCSFTSEGFSAYKTIVDSNSLSTRSMDRLAKVARTIADLADSDALDTPHLEKAATYVIGGILREGL
jgi:magnesium chelatase family protein